MTFISFRRLLGRVALLTVFFAGSALAQDRSLMASEPRVALVIGNSSYEVGPLKNPTNDADDIAEALRSLNFRVTKLTNATNREIIEAINRFGQELRKGGVGLFFFAGHGVQSRGRNYLIPVGASISSEDQLEFESVDANRVLGAMDAAGNRVNIVILDACRDNPYARSFRSAARGLAQMDPARGSFVAFATAPGSSAADGSGRNGLYTHHLLQSLKDADSDIDKVFRRVTADVSRASGGKQVPWISHSLTGDFYFRFDSKLSDSSVGTPADQTPLGPAVATSQPTSDSAAAAAWTAYIRCDPHLELPAYTAFLRVTVLNGEYTLERLKPGNIGHLILSGKPTANGELRLLGTVVSRATHVRGRITDAEFQGRLHADQFEMQGRTGNRQCNLTLSRRAS